MNGLTVFVLVDALGWELIRDRAFLGDLLPYRQPVQSLLGFSSGIIPSMLTGLPPAESGMWNLVYYDPQNSPFRWMKSLGTAPARVFDNRVGRRLLTELGRRFLRIGDNFDVSVPPETLPWFNWAESRNIYARNGVPGHSSVFDLLYSRKIEHKVYSYKDGLTDQEILLRAEKDIAEGNEQFYFLYLCELDAFLHLHRKEMPQIEAKFAWYEDALRRVFHAACKRSPGARLQLSSDHGMTPVERHCDLAAIVKSCGYRTPKDYLAVYDSTMARFWFFSQAARDEILGRLRKLDYVRLLREQELRDLGVYFADHRYGEEIVLLNPGCIIAESGFNGNGWKPAGMHGYHPAEDPNATAVYMTNCAPASPPQTVRDVFRFMTEACA